MATLRLANRGVKRGMIRKALRSLRSLLSRWDREIPRIFPPGINVDGGRIEANNVANSLEKALTATRLR